MNKYWINIAINLAYTNLGRTGCKPSVGCVIVKDDIFLASGVTLPSGEHAEAEAVKYAKSCNIKLDDATMYVTLEPCAHYGQTPPCVNTILEAGIKNIVIGIEDPDPRVSGKGIEFLKKNGINVIVLDDEKVRELYQSYFVFKKEKRPYVILKIAQSIDGKIATGSGVSKWITSENARRYTNFLRSRFGGILVGANTVKNDSPKLDCRIAGLEKFSPKKFCASLNEFDGFESVSGSSDEMLLQIYENNIQSLLIEGGANLITQFVKANLFDEVILVQAPIFIGSDGMPAIKDLNLTEIPMAKMKIIEKIQIDNNIFIRYKNEK